MPQKNCLFDGLCRKTIICLSLGGWQLIAAAFLISLLFPGKEVKPGSRGGSARVPVAEASPCAPGKGRAAAAPKPPGGERSVCGMSVVASVLSACFFELSSGIQPKSGGCGRTSNGQSQNTFTPAARISSRHCRFSSVCTVKSASIRFIGHTLFIAWKPILL